MYFQCDIGETRKSLTAGIQFSLVPSDHIFLEFDAGYSQVINYHIHINNIHIQNIYFVMKIGGHKPVTRISASMHAMHVVSRDNLARAVDKL